MRQQQPFLLWTYSLILLLTNQSFSEPSPVGFDKAQQLLQHTSDLRRQPRTKETMEALSTLTASVPLQVPGLITQASLDLLNSPGPHTAAELHSKLSAALQAGREQGVPEVFVYPLDPNPNPAGYFIAYNVVYCASCSRSWIGILGQKTGPYHVISEDKDPPLNSSLAVTPLPSTPDKEVRFLISGTHWGDSHNRLSVTLYTFAADILGKRWTLTDLPQGRLVVTPTAITVSYLTSLAPPWNEKTEVYSISATEIKLQQSSERPNP